MLCDIDNGALEIIYNDSNGINAAADVIKRAARYREEAWGENGYMHSLAAHGQTPSGLFLTGISPYVAPEKVFGLAANDAFVHRRLGGHYHHERTPGGMAATIEFAIASGIKTLVIVGHENDVNDDYVKGKLDHLPLTKAFLEKSTPDMQAWRESGMSPSLIHENGLKSTYYNVRKHPSVAMALAAGKLSILMLSAKTSPIADKCRLRCYDPINDNFLTVLRPTG